MPKCWAIGSAPWRATAKYAISTAVLSTAATAIAVTGRTAPLTSIKKAGVGRSARTSMG